MREFVIFEMMKVDDAYAIFDSFDASTNANTTITTITTQQRHHCCRCQVEPEEDGCVAICPACGVIVDRVVDERPEWKDMHSEKSRIGAPESTGAPLGTSLRLPKHVQITSLQCLGLKAKDRALLSAFDQITNRCRNAQIPQSVISDANALYKMASASVVSRKTRRVNLMAACVQEACSRHRAARSAKEIADIFNINMSSLSLGCKHFRSVVVLEEGAVSSTPSASTVAACPSPRAVDFIGRFCSRLGLDKTVKNRALKLANNAQADVMGPAPQSIAAACIWVAGEEALDASIVAEACGVCQVTLSKVATRIVVSLSQQH